MKTKILSILALLLMTVTQGAWAQETLTVFDGEGTSQYIPMYGRCFDYYTKSECIIPASELTAMKGGTITAITFYAKTMEGSNPTFGTAKQKVFLKEVSGTTLSSYSGMDDATVVFDGTLPMPTTSEDGYTITFSKGYTYNGGNLLIGIYNAAKGSWRTVFWYGNNNQSSGVSAFGTSYDDLASVGKNNQTFLPKTTFTYTPAPTAVDLGLPSGKKWANRNVGALSATGYGTYFAWAATASQADYSQANAPYYSGSAYTKYTGSDYTMLQRGDDAATVNWGSNWRMPTDTELQELIDNTTKEWKTNYNGTGVNGYLVTSKTNGNSIFLPAAGWYNGTELRSASQGGNYWMSTVVTSDVSCGYSLNFYSTSLAPYKDNTDTRYVGFSIRPVQMFAGEGTKASPYLIASTTDWNNLVSAVNGGETYSGNYFKMTANVGDVTPVSTWMTGDLTTTGIFSGHFDGNGHTLTVNYSSDTQYCHPFGFLRGATIENLHVTGNITTSQTYAAGLASRALSNSTNYITNCLVSTNITSTRSGTANICGVVMSVQANATLYIEGCAFTGSITSSNGTDNGGFSEWVTAGGTFSATNCLFAPSSVTDNSLVNSATFCRNGGTFSGCYFTRTLGTAQGLQARSISAGDYVSTLAISGDATATYAVSGITAYAHGIKYNDVYYASNSDAVSLTLAAESRDGYRFKQYTTTGGTITAQTETSASLTMPDANVTISAEYDPFSGGSGTSVNPYQIASTADWNLLVSNVNAGETYSGNYFKMTANISVTTRMSNTFSGTFDGDGNTLTVTYSQSGGDYCAPFGYMSGATVENLKVAGTISSSSGYRQASIGGRVANSTIRKCTSSVAFTLSQGDWVECGGLVAHLVDNTTLTMTGCAFTGSITYSNATGYAGGGLIGWLSNGCTVTLTDCVFNPSSVSFAKESDLHFYMFADIPSGDYTLNLTRCYYNGTAACNDKITKQDGTMQMHTIAAGDYVSALSVTKGAATETYDVSGITVYSGGIDFNDGSTTTFYGGSGQSVSLALTAEERSGYQFKQYVASQGSLSDETTDAPTLTMPAANSTANDAVTISAEYDPLYNAAFADASDASNGWSISPTSGIVGSTVTVSYTGENKVKSVTVAPKGALTGKFSVSSTKQVQFSKGNLQYVGTWQFAANQYDIFGESQSDNHRDLFGWGTKTNPNNTSTTNGDYSWAEWGENTITNGCTGWRTLTKDEWGYLFTDRTNASTLRTFATVNSVKGLIVMPDGWTASGVTLTITTENYTTNVLSTSQWATLEKQGCVFLPAAGGRAGTDVVNVGTIGDYWSSDASGETNAYDLNFSNNHLLPQNAAGQRHYGWSVRLVRDVE